MLSRHPDVDELQAFLKGASRSAGAMQIVRHLLDDCSICRERLCAMGWDPRRLERLLYIPSSEAAAPPAAGRHDYDAAFAKADRALAAFFAPAKALDVRVEDLANETLSLSAEERLRRIAEDDRFANPHLVQYLIDSGHKARYQDPERMLHLTQSALLAAKACTAQAAGNELRLADLRARAWGYHGNSLRICGHLREAEEALARAGQESDLGTGDPPLRAHLLEQVATLRSHQRRFEDAIEAAAAASRIYRDLGDSHAFATAIIQKAYAHMMAGDSEKAIDLINRAIPLIDFESGPDLLLVACHNLVRCYIDLGQPDRALAVYTEIRDLYREFDQPLIVLRATWQEGQLLRDMGHLQQAETKLLEAQKGFLDRGLTYEAAVLALDLAALYLKTGASADVRQTAAAAVPIFRALGVDRDALASLRQLQQIADRDHEAMDLIRFLTARIEPLAKRGLLK
jgi:tetratricopeptide (TPR) repeat protein